MAGITGHHRSQK